MSSPASVATATTPNTTDDRLASIVDAINTGIGAAMRHASDREALTEQLDDLKEAGQSARERIMANLAEMASTDEWTPTEIDAAASLAASKRNAKLPTSIATFVSEMKIAMHPNVRDDFQRISSSTTEAWANETAAKEVSKDAPTPIRKAFARQYHFKVKVMREAAEGRTYPAQDDLIAFAKANDPDHDPGKVFKRLGKIVSDLNQFHTDFPVDNIGAVLDFLKEITEEDLTAARRSLLGLPPVESQAVASTSTPVVKAKSSAKAKAAEPVPPTHAPTPATDVSADAFIDSLLDNPANVLPDMGEDVPSANLGVDVAAMAASGASTAMAA